MDIRLLAVDGLNLVRRIFEARQVQHAADMPAAIEATTASLQRALSRHEPTHAAVVLEYNRKTWRHLLFPEYKAGRSETPALLLDALRDYRIAFERIGVHPVEVAGFEADDIIASMARVVADNGGSVVVLSTDKVYLQLLSEQITVFDHFNEHAWDAGQVQENYGISVAQYIDYLALVGDTSNNIKGVPGVGPKTAVQLLSRYERLDDILAQQASGKAHEKVLDAQPEAVRSRQLVTLKTDVELGINLRSLRVS